MKFLIDQQSLKDLNILGKYQSDSIFSLFNSVKTAGGEKLLEKLFWSPLMDADKINERTNTLFYLQQKNITFPFSSEETREVSDFLEMPEQPSQIAAALSLLRKRISKEIIRSADYDEDRKRILEVVSWLNKVKKFVEECTDDSDHTFQKELAIFRSFFQKKSILHLLKEYEVNVKPRQTLSMLQMVRWVHILSSSFRQVLYDLLTWVYWMDVVIAITTVAKEKKMNYAYARPASFHLLSASELRHPCMDKAVTNTISLNRDENVVFLTGANMAGKSTWMKTIGVSLYLAHMGFPISAKSYEFSVVDGIFSSINVPDNLAMGLSHFYAEVLRVKEVATSVNKGKNLMVLFDELFKGTNVKDAYDATLAVTKAFAKFTNCRFIISTHIIEVGDELVREKHSIQYKYLPTEMEGTKPIYTRVLKDGITSDRQGMMIIKNEKILEIIGT